ncbi:MAG: hypothetical protein WA294_05185, partial [Acidobacteriaceae bacterium]
TDLRGNGDLESWDLRKYLERPNRRIEALFPGEGFASVVAIQPSGKQVEVGLIGREGRTAWQSCLATTARPMQPIQGPGKSQCISAVELRQATQTSQWLRDSLLKFVQ